MSYCNCDRCGARCEEWSINELSTPYQFDGMKRLCDNCGKKANSFLGHYGRKKKEDIDALALYLKSGKVSSYNEKKRVNSLFNAGYF